MAIRSTQRSAARNKRSAMRLLADATVTDFTSSALKVGDRTFLNPNAGGDITSECRELDLPSGVHGGDATTCLLKHQLRTCRAGALRTFVPTRFPPAVAVPSSRSSQLLDQGLQHQRDRELGQEAPASFEKWIAQIEPCVDQHLVLKTQLNQRCCNGEISPINPITDPRVSIK